MKPKLIAHRGNMHGPSPNENNPECFGIVLARGFDIEVDVWYREGHFVLGHDKPKYPVSKELLQSEHFWCHAKNPDAIKAMEDNDIHHFWHENDQYTLTSKGYTWCHPEATYIPGSILNQPEWNDASVIYQLTPAIMNSYFAICSDYLMLLDDIYEGNLFVEIRSEKR